MKSLFFLTLFILFCEALCGCSQSTPPYHELSIREYYILNAGDRWNYNEITFDSLGNTLSNVPDTLLVSPLQYKGHDAFKFASERDSLPVAVQYYSDDDVVNVDLKSPDSATTILLRYPLKVGE